MPIPITGKELQRVALTGVITNIQLQKYECLKGASFTLSSHNKKISYRVGTDGLHCQVYEKKNDQESIIPVLANLQAGDRVCVSGVVRPPQIVDRQSQGAVLFVSRLEVA